MSGLLQSTFQNFRKFPKIIPIDFVVVGGGGAASPGYPNTGISAIGTSGTNGGAAGNGGGGASSYSGAASFWEKNLASWITLTVGGGGTSGGGGVSEIKFAGFKTGVDTSAGGGAPGSGWGGGTLVIVGSYYARNGSTGPGNGTISYVTGAGYGYGGAGGAAFANGTPGSHGAGGTGNGGGGGGGGGNTNSGGPGGHGGSGTVVVRCTTSDFSSYSATGTPVVTTSGVYTLFKFTQSGTLRIE